MDSEAAVPLINAVASVLDATVMFSLLVVMCIAALRFDRWAEARGLGWHFLGGGLWGSYLWPDSKGEEENRVLPAACMGS